MDDLRQILESAGIPCDSLEALHWSCKETVYGINSHDADPMETWRELCRLSVESHHWPVITDNIETLDRLNEQIDSFQLSAFSPEQQRDWAWVKELPEDWREWVFRGEKMSFESWLEAQEKELPLEEEFMGEWTDNAAIQTQPCIARAEECLILLFPVESFWHIPALLRYGNWNDCPSPDVHVAALRYWNDHYGAQLLSMTFDTMELTVKRPPKTKDEAIELAKQHFYFCGDTAPDGFLNLASQLKDSTVWTFWWD